MGAVWLERVKPLFQLSDIELQLIPLFRQSFVLSLYNIVYWFSAEYNTYQHTKTRPSPTV